MPGQLISQRPKPPARPATGVVYLALNDSYRDLTAASVSALRRYGYQGPVRVVSDKAGWLSPGLGCEDSIVPAVGDGYAVRYYKTQLLRFAYDWTLFLDSDAIPVSGIDGIWEFLADCHLAMSPDMYPLVGDLIEKDRTSGYWQDEYDLMLRLGQARQPHFNSGVMLFRKSVGIGRLFAAWHREWQCFRGRDQLALTRAMASTGIWARPMPGTWNCAAGIFSSVREAQDAGIKIMHFWSSHRRLMTNKLVSVLQDVTTYPRGGEWETWDLHELSRGQAADRNPRAPHVPHGRGGGFLVQAAPGTAGNVEMAIPGNHRGVHSYWHSPDAPLANWHDSVVVGDIWGKVASATLLRSNLGDQGNLELVIRVGGKLGHYWRNHAPDGAWQGARWFADGAAGNPSLIQSSYGYNGHFELVVPRQAGGVAHYRRDNDRATRPWTGPDVFALELGQVDAAVLLQSSLGEHRNLEVIVRVGDYLAHYWRAGRGPGGWHGPVFLFTGAAGVPGFIQSSYGTAGNFEVLTPMRHGGLAHLWRDNSMPDRPWKISTCLDAGGTQITAVSLAQAASGPGSDLVAATRSGGRVTWYWRHSRLRKDWSSQSLW